MKKLILPSILFFLCMYSSKMNAQFGGAINKVKKEVKQTEVPSRNSQPTANPENNSTKTADTKPSKIQLYNDSVNKAEIQSRKIGKAAYHNQKYEDLIFKYWKSKGFEDPTEVVLTTTEWNTEKNQYGAITGRFTYTEATAKKISDGKCYLLLGNIYEDYQGGDKYGNSFHKNFLELEMNCENMKK